MNKYKKLVAKFKNQPQDFTYEDAIVLLRHNQFKLNNKGRTSGSRVQFLRGDVKIDLHKPHPQNTLKRYQLQDLSEGLKKAGIRL